MSFILNRCAGKSVLHLGCSGGEALTHWLGRGKEYILHVGLSEVARELYGVDIHEPSLTLLREMGFSNLYLGNVESLEHVDVRRKFDVIVAADLIEHLSNPGRMLDGIHRFMDARSELMISTPNAFGLPNFLRNFFRRFQDGPEHVAMFNSDNLANLFGRHGYDLTVVYGGYDKPAWTFGKRLGLLAGAWFLRLKPENGGTLIAVARSKSDLKT